MARLTIAWVKEYAKANGIFLVKTSAGYAVQYQRLIDELTYEDGIGYKEVFKTLKEVKDWIDDQNPIDVLGIDKEAAREIYEDAKKFSDKVDREMGVDREEEEVTPLETYVNDVVSRESWILSLTEDELDNSGLSDQEVSFWVKNQNKSEENKEEVGKMVKDKEITFEEVKDFALNCGYELTEGAVCGYCNFTLYSTNRVGEFTELVDIVETIKDGRLLNSEFCDLPLPIDLTYEDVKEFVFSAGYSKFNGWHNGFLLDLTPTKGKYLPTLVDVMDVVKSGELLRGESCDLPLPKDCAKFIGMDENKLCFENSNGDIELIARAISLDYLKSHQSVIKNPNFTDRMKWESFNDLMGKVLAQI